MSLVAPSILSANFSHLGRDIREVCDAGARLIHFDVMDNHFVPNLTIGPLVLESLRRDKITVDMDVHLMVENPRRLIDDFAKSGADMISIHPNSTHEVHECLQQIRGHGCLAGLALNPDQSHVLALPFFEQIDFVLLMSVFPGFSGQRFIPETLDKSRGLRKIIDSRAQGNNKPIKPIKIEMDGGIHQDNLHEVCSAGVDIAVMGSAIFNDAGIDDNFTRACNEAQRVLRQ